MEQLSKPHQNILPVSVKGKVNTLLIIDAVKSHVVMSILKVVH